LRRGGAFRVVVRNLACRGALRCDPAAVNRIDADRLVLRAIHKGEARILLDGRTPHAVVFAPGYPSQFSLEVEGYSKPQVIEKKNNARAASYAQW